MHDACPNNDTNAQLGALSSLPVSPAVEFSHWPDRMAPSAEKAPQATTSPQAKSPMAPEPLHDQPATDNKPHPTTGLLNQHEYRLCCAIRDHRLQPSSRYAKLAGMSSKTAVAARKRLVTDGLVHERRVDTAGPGSGSILLELSAEGVRAVAAYEVHMTESGSADAR